MKKITVLSALACTTIAATVPTIASCSEPRPSVTLSITETAKNMKGIILQRQQSEGVTTSYDCSYIFTLSQKVSKDELITLKNCEITTGGDKFTIVGTPTASIVDDIYVLLNVKLKPHGEQKLKLNDACGLKASFVSKYGELKETEFTDLTFKVCEELTDFDGNLNNAVWEQDATSKEITLSGLKLTKAFSGTIKLSKETPLTATYIQDSNKSKEWKITVDGGSLIHHNTETVDLTINPTTEATELLPNDAVFKTVNECSITICFIPEDTSYVPYESSMVTAGPIVINPKNK